MQQPAERSWLDSVAARVGLGLLFLAVGGGIVLGGLGTAHGALNAIVIGAVVLLFGVLLLVAGPRRVDSWIRRHDDKHNS
jgi:hypothetical protein